MGVLGYEAVFGGYPFGVRLKINPGAPGFRFAQNWRMAFFIFATPVPINREDFQHGHPEGSGLSVNQPPNRATSCIVEETSSCLCSLVRLTFRLPCLADFLFLSSIPLGHLHQFPPVPLRPSGDPARFSYNLISSIHLQFQSRNSCRRFQNP